jgi:4-alpha-glucanotransferase
MAFNSPANLAIIQAQDILNLSSKHRMNTPGSTKNNWRWRLKPGQFDLKAVKKLAAITKYSQRDVLNK